MTRAEPLYQLVECNRMLGGAHAIGAPAPLAELRARAVARYPRPDALRAYVALVARPMTAGPEVELVKGTA